MTISDPDPKAPLEAKDRCFRLAGELLTVPQTDEEEKFLYDYLMNFMMMKAANNLTYLSMTRKTARFWVGGETKISDLHQEFPDLLHRCLIARDSPYLQYLGTTIRYLVIY